MILRKRLLKSVNWEYIVPLFACTVLLASCIIVSNKKFFWNDEMLSFFLIDDRSLLHMFSAWGDKFNQAPPLYFVLGWLWAKVFGSSDLSLRLFSSVTLCIAFTLVWLTLRRTYHFWAVGLGTLAVFCLSELVLYHNVEVRMYGLFAAICALGVFLFDAMNRQEHCSQRILIANCFTHAAIVLTHLYGVFYSGAILISFVLVDRALTRFRPRVYLSLLAGWLFLVPLIPTIVEQSNNAAKWFSVPSRSRFFNYLLFSSLSLHIIIAFCIAAAFLRVIEAFYKDHDKASKDNFYRISEAWLFVLAAAFLAVPFLALLISTTVKPILNDRYLIPTITVSWSILLTYLTSLLFPEIALEKGKTKVRKLMFNSRNLLLSTLALLILIYPINHARKWREYTSRPGANDLSFGYVNLPIAMEAGHDFLPRLRYAANPERYFHIRDWETAVKNTTSSYATGDYVHLEALSRQYSFIQSVQSQAFLSQHDRFLVLNENDQKWFESRIKNDTAYNITSLGTTEGELDSLEMFLVEKRKR